MYGGNDRNLSEIIAEVNKTVIGQDDAVECYARSQTQPTPALA